MVYIDKNSKDIIIPRHTSIDGTTYTITISSNLSNEFVLSNNVDYSLSQLFYKFRLTEPLNLNVGEYEYIVRSNDTILEKGLLVYGDYNSRNSVIKDTKRNKIQYERKN